MLKLKEIINFLNKPQVIIFVIACGNFLYFFTKSNTYQSIGSHGIDFCAYCPWYWDWSLINLPSLSLLATLCLNFRNYKLSLIACLISSYEVVQGIIWIFGTKGFIEGLKSRLDIIQNFNYEYGEIQDLLDFQYLFALIILLISFALMTRAVQKNNSIKFK